MLPRIILLPLTFSLTVICEYLPGTKDLRDIWNVKGGTEDSKDAACGTYAINVNMTHKIQTTYQQFQLFYQTGFDCTWKFYGSKCYPVISCDLFELPDSADCSSSRLEVSDDHLASKRYCGNNGPKNTTTGSTILSATFTRSIAIPRKGFICFVSCVSNTEGFDVINKTITPPQTANCTCGIPGVPGDGTKHRIVGGSEAVPFFWKWQVGLVPKTRSNPVCGGSLINDRFVLSAAHCVITTGLFAVPQAGDVILNGYNLKNPSEPTIRRGIMAIHPHPLYDPVSQDYDISLIELNEPVSLVSTGEPSVHTVCLPPKNMWDSLVGKTGTVTGWGVTAEGGKQSLVLKEADIPIISNFDCFEQYKRNKSSRIVITERMLCAAYENGGIDACQGDSGGPFVLKRDDGSYMQIGVVSFGEGCARQGKPGVYSRVTEVNDWIRSTAKQGTWCNE